MVQLRTIPCFEWCEVNHCAERDVLLYKVTSVFLLIRELMENQLQPAPASILPSTNRLKIGCRNDRPINLFPSTCISFLSCNLSPSNRALLFNPELMQLQGGVNPLCSPAYPANPPFSILALFETKNVSSPSVLRLGINYLGGNQTG